MAAFAKPQLELPAAGMNLAGTLFCGQSFSWHATGDGWLRGVAGHRAAAVRQEEDRLLLRRLDCAPVTEADETFWRHYFALDTDYAFLHARYAGHKQLAECVARAPGIRVLRQPFFDTLLSFIISQNNHIGRITGIVDRLRQSFGPSLAGGEHGFPAPEALATLTPEDLAPLRAGFRAKYLIDAAQRVASGEVDEALLRALPDDQARQTLLRIHGVGVKVADCVLLYALERDSVVPMDVWMKRAMAMAFPKGMPRVARGSEGIAQQYIFVWARENLPRGK